jgi:hypothetical protein
MNDGNTGAGKTSLIDPNERRWLERKAVELARSLNCPLPDALVAARCEFESLRTRPKAIVIPLVGQSRRGLKGPHEASN